MNQTVNQATSSNTPLSHLTDAAAKAAKTKINSVIDEGQQIAGKVIDGTTHLASELPAMSKKVTKSIMTFTRERPFQAALMAVGIGLVVGTLVTRKFKKSAEKTA